MASFSRLASKKWRAQIDKRGVRKSASFKTKAEAQEWATREEAEIERTRHGSFPRKTVGELWGRYAAEVSPRKAGRKFETDRLNAFTRDFPWLARKIVSEVTASDITRWRDERLKSVSAASVHREMTLLSNVFKVATKEWGWCADSPVSGVSKPADSAPRTRRVLPSEVRRICRRLGYVTGHVETKTQQVALAFLIGLRTAMRAGEILALSPARVDLQRRVVTVPHKMQYLTRRERTIPITKRGARLVAQIPVGGWTIDGAMLDALFRKARDQLLIKDLHFHDSRAEALTRLSRKVDIMTLARISGHADLRILQNTYYRESAEDIAARLS